MAYIQPGQLCQALDAVLNRIFVDEKRLGNGLNRALCTEKGLQKADLLGNFAVAAVPKDLFQVGLLPVPGYVVHQQLYVQRFVAADIRIAVGGGVPGPVGLQIGLVEVFRRAVDAEDHLHIQLLTDLPAEGPAQGDHFLRALLAHQQDLPGGIAQQDAALLADTGIQRLVDLLQDHLAVQGVRVFFPVPGGGNNAAPGTANIDAQGEAALGKRPGVVQPGAQNPVLQKAAAHTQVQLPVVQLGPFPDEDLRHFLDDLAVFDDGVVVAGDADDSLELPIHHNGQIDAPAHIGQLVFQLRCDVKFRKVLGDDAVGPLVEFADPGRVVAGDDVPGLVHQIDILPDQLADLFHDLLGAFLRDPHGQSASLYLPSWIPVRYS